MLVALVVAANEREPIGVLLPQLFIAIAVVLCGAQFVLLPEHRQRGVRLWFLSLIFAGVGLVLRLANG